MKRFFWFMVWVLGIVSMSRLFHAGRSWREESGLGFVSMTVAWLVVFIAAMFLLLLRTYAQERARGNVVHRVAIFERVLERGAADAD